MTSACHLFRYTAILRNKKFVEGTVPKKSMRLTSSLHSPTYPKECNISLMYRVQRTVQWHCKNI